MLDKIWNTQQQQKNTTESKKKEKMWKGLTLAINAKKEKHNTMF
jgi:hypothetical protein